MVKLSVEREGIEVGEVREGGRDLTREVKEVKVETSYRS